MYPWNLAKLEPLLATNTIIPAAGVGIAVSRAATVAYTANCIDLLVDTVLAVTLPVNGPDNAAAATVPLIANPPGWNEPNE